MWPEFRLGEVIKGVYFPAQVTPAARQRGRNISFCKYSAMCKCGLRRALPATPAYGADLQADRKVATGTRLFSEADP
ncbi:hypothetical protein EYF80_035998 [Liparis tanakae]|uniref:Uncharacterized protein n=1 Tax=Liparis tanakae TaxID=230148 RepID=A0A4Z2GLW6_9TELE|nr:hypothetical protein EYF80_035998 [Liparis tanakae]